MLIAGALLVDEYDCHVSGKCGAVATKINPQRKLRGAVRALPVGLVALRFEVAVAHALGRTQFRHPVYGSGGGKTIVPAAALTTIINAAHHDATMQTRLGKRVIFALIIGSVLEDRWCSDTVSPHVYPLFSRAVSTLLGTWIAFIVRSWSW